MIYTDGIHLVADTLDELHQFARSIDLSKWYYAGVRKGHPHYDLIKKGSLKRALDAGAIQTNSKQILAIAKQAFEFDRKS